MRIRLLTGLAGRGFSHAPRSVIDVSDADAKRLIAKGYAEPIEEPKYETAMVEQTERAVKPKKRRGR